MKANVFNSILSEVKTAAAAMEAAAVTMVVRTYIHMYYTKTYGGYREKKLISK
jgi:hypothetical protein